jgi:integrase
MHKGIDMSSSPSKDVTRRGKVFYFRARVPAEFVTAFGRAMVSISLQTDDPVEARLRAAIHRRDLDLALKALGQEQRVVSPGYSGPLLHLTDADVEHICKSYRAFKLAGDELERVAGKHSNNVELEADIYAEGVKALRQAFARGDLQDVYKNLGDYLRTNGPRVLPNTPQYEKLARAFQVAEIEVYEAILQRRRGNAIDIPLGPQVGEETFETVFARWKGRKAKRNLKTVEAFQGAYALLRLHCTAMSPAMVTKADAVHLRDVLIAEDEKSRTTIAKIFSFLRAIFQCSVNDEKLKSNPFDKVDVEIDEKAKVTKSRVPFSKDELSKIFSGAVYCPGFVPRKGLGQSCYWLPLVSLFTGARLEEIGQMHSEDLQFDRELGVHFMAVFEEGQREVKNPSSIRNIVLHPELVKLGFVDFVQASKAGRLFPTLRPDKYGILTTTYSTWFGRYMDSLGLTNRQLVFHSFRHTFNEICKKKVTLIPAEVREAMLGHISPDEIRATYGDAQYPLEPQIEALKHIDYGIDLSHLYPKPKEEILAE